MAKKTNNISKKRNYIEEKKKAENLKKYEATRKRLRAFPVVALVFSIGALLLFLADWAAVFNTAMNGNEVRVSGFNCLTAALGGNFTGTGSAFGDIAVPFNYYAKAATHSLSYWTIAAFAVACVSIVVNLLAAATNKQPLNVVSAAVFAAEGALLIVCFAIALSMKDANILSGYCNNNPACSIKSQAILPAILSLLAIGLPIASLILHNRSKKLLA